MAYSVTGTAGTDVLNQASDTGPGTIVGLAGDDCIFTGSGLATVTGDSGNDTVVLRTGNTGTVNGGSENDSIFSVDDVGSMVLFGGDGADLVNLNATTSAQTVVGGNDSSDGNDVITTGSGADLVFGNGGNDQVFLRTGGDTTIGGAGNDLFQATQNGDGSQLFFGNEGNDSCNVAAGNDMAFLGLGNDSFFLFGAAGAAAPVVFGNEGADTINLQLINTDPTSSTIVGGNDSADAGDSLSGARGTDLIFGNGGDDSIDGGAGANTGNNTLIGGFGNDCILARGGADLIFANESNDRVNAGDGNNTVFGGLGNDNVLTGAGRDTIQGNEGNDTIQGDNATSSIDTISGGAGNDVFAYEAADQDGENATGGGPVELITDVNWAEDKFDTTPNITFAANTGAGTGGTLVASANNAINSVTALNGGVDTVAAQFTFGGRSYLAINLANNGFLDADDLLLDITGVTGTIGSGNFI